jgi:hypothetical protein
MSDESEIARKLSEAGGKGKAPKPQEKPSRREKKAFTTWHDPAVIRQIKVICFENEITQQDFIKEALNLAFAKYKKPQIA